MEAIGRTAALHLCTALLILTEVSSELIHVPSSLLHGVKGRSLLLHVETRFRLDNAEIQGTWYQTTPNAPITQLVTFTNDTAIINMIMKYQNRFSFKAPNASLFINRLDEAAEGEYHLVLNIQLDLNMPVPQRPGPVQEKRTITVTVDVPVSTPIIKKTPSSAVVEDKENVTWTCSVENGTRVQFQWLRDNVPIHASERHWFYQNSSTPQLSTMVINPVRKEDIGRYRCVASNAISQRKSHTVNLSVFYGPYNLAVRSGQGLRTGEVFTVNPGEVVFFDCQADSNPPNSCVWISKTNNATEVIMIGPRLEARTSHQLAHAEEYLCRAFNNVTQKQDETQFTLLVASVGRGKEKNVQVVSDVSLLAVAAVSSLFIIGCMLLVFLLKTCHPKRVLMNIYNRPLTEQKRLHRSGHEDATEDFGIYEFVSIPGKMESTQASSRSLAHLESVQDMHTTIYDVIRHIPETPTQSLLEHSQNVEIQSVDSRLQ